VRGRPVDLGVCRGYRWEGRDAASAVVLPGATWGGMPVAAFAINALLTRGWSVVQVWDEYVDPAADPVEWARVRAEAALDAAADPRLIVAKSITSLATPVAAERSVPGAWLTPLLDEARCVEGLRARTAPALLVGGTADSSWDGTLARELSDDVLELPDVDHGLVPGAHLLGTFDTLRQVTDAIDAFAARL
jgi:hypothetical protein